MTEKFTHVDFFLMPYLNIILGIISITGGTADIESQINNQNIPQINLSYTVTEYNPEPLHLSSSQNIPTVPFLSQFTDISRDDWKKRACGIVSLAMLIELYKPGEINVNELLEEGIASGAYLNNAGWIHNGLALLAKDHGLYGKSYDFVPTTMNNAFNELEKSLNKGPVIASVHYKLDPKNTIPHLIVINSIKNGQISFNDPAENHGDMSISVENFIKAWKKRYIEIRPHT